MTDAFALLGESRRPVLDPEALKARFLQLSAEAHPDRVHGGDEAERSAAQERYAALSAAYQTLREPRDRLLHLLTLERGEAPRDIQRIPPGTMDLFVEVGQTCRDCDAFLSGRREATAPMLRLQGMREGLDWLRRLQELQSRVGGYRDALAEGLRELDGFWQSAPPVGDASRGASLPLDRLEDLYRGQSYVSRWTDQIQERIVQLAAT